MLNFAKVLVIVTGALVLASVWAPGDWWKWLLSAFILLATAEAVDQKKPKR